MAEYDRNTQFGDLQGAVKRAKKYHSTPVSGGAKAMVVGMGILAAAGVAGGAYALAQRDAEPETEYIAGQLVVKFDRELEITLQQDGNVVTGLDEVDALNAQLQGESYEQLVAHSDEHGLDQWYVITFDESEDIGSLIERFSAADGVIRAERNGWMHPEYEVPELTDEQITAFEETLSAAKVPNDPYYSSEGSWGQGFKDMWGLHNTRAAEAWETTTGASDMIIAITDTGVDYNHPDIAGRVITEFDYDFVNSDNDAMDDHGHGTHVAGTIAATTNNGIGIAGVTWQGRILPIKVCNASGGCSWTDVARGFAYAADHGASVVNVSLGGYATIIPGPISEAIDYAVSKGTYIVASAGNDGRDAAHHFPSCHPLAFSAAATTHDDQRAGFSNWGTRVDVGAPGEYILSLLAQNHKFGNRAPIVGERYVVLRGTSMAAPHTTADVALILAANPELRGDWEAVKGVLLAGVDRVDTDKPIGTGRINYARAVEEARKKR